MKLPFESGKQGIGAILVPARSAQPVRFLLIFCSLAFSTVAHGAMQDTDNTDETHQTDRAEFVDLFDGKSLDGWSFDKDYWSVVDGVIVGQTTAEKPLEHNTFLIWNGEVRDFELELEFRISAVNSGVQFRSVDKGSHRVTGYQADFDAANNYTGIIYEEGGRGILAPRAQHVTIGGDGTRKASDEATCDEKAFLASIRAGDWNQSRVIARGSQITHMINGFVTARLDDGETGKASDKGIIALQLHVGDPMKVEFRKIRLKRFD